MTTQEKVNDVVASLAIEGYILDEESKERLQKVADGKISAEDALDEIYSKYRSDRWREYI